MTAKVFISSTGFDLKDYRAAAIEVCNRLMFVPIAMEFFEAMSVGATEGSKQKIDEAELYIGIFAHRYGYVEAGYDQAVTEIEFEHAGEHGLDRLCFLVDPTYPWPPDAIDYKNYSKLEEFKLRIKETHVRSLFTDINDFKAKLLQALVDWKQENLNDAAGSEEKVSMEAPSPASAPPLPALMIGRDEDIETMKERLGLLDSDKFVRNTIIHGWPGVGKTTLITSLAYDDDVQAEFPDGILWASAGENPNPVKGLHDWSRALGADMSSMTSLEDGMKQLRALLKDKKALLIIDDVWDADAASPFLVGGSSCATIITTRFLDTAEQIAVIPEEIFKLGRLSDELGFELLQKVAPRVTDQYQVQSKKLVGDLEGLPLALRVAGRLLESDASAGFDVIESFELLSNSHKMLEEKAPDDRFDSSTGTTPTVGLLLKKSTDRIDDFTRDCFAALGTFAPKPATFDLNAMKGVWLIDDPKPVARKLVDRGLLEPIPSQGRFWMHAVLVMFAESLLEDE